MLLPRAAAGRDVLATSLRAAGATVDDLPLYETVPDPVRAAEAATRLLAGQFRAVLFFSPSAVESLRRALSTAPDDSGASLPPGVLVACIGPTTADAAERAGWRVDVLAPDTTARSLVDALAAHLGEKSLAPAAPAARRRRAMTSTAPTGGRGGALVLAGVSHHTAHVAVREPLAAACAGEGEAALRRAVREAVGPAVTLVTCNRLEVYAWAPQRPARAAARLQRLLAAQAGVPLRDLRPHVFARSGVDAIEHLIRVASGLDSLALGECQIIGQVREAFLAGAAEGPLGPQLHLTFQHALEAGRRVRQLGGLDRHPSVAAIAVHVAAMELGTLRGKEVAVLGAGVTGKAAALALAATGAARIHLLNRSPERAAALAAGLALGERAVPGALDDLPHALATCDAVVCATAATRPVILAGT